MYTLGNMARLGVELGQDQGFWGNIDGRHLDQAQAGGHGNGDIPASRAHVEDTATRVLAQKLWHIAQSRLNHPFGIGAWNQHPRPHAQGAATKTLARRSGRRSAHSAPRRLTKAWKRASSSVVN